ncbi:MAG: polymerase sigma factor, sigma-70 family [Verrucomicrobiales bacterium]|nr:polymerase sigma factor, sigma-70 family [Verrucomicrobiales bacterium]
MPDPLDIERLYDANAQALFSFLLNLIRNEADTRDILQEIFVKIAHNPKILKGVRNERSYLIRLAHNLAIDLIRRRATRVKNHEQIASETIGIFTESQKPDEAAYRTALEAALVELPVEQRAVVHLKLWEELTFDRIAKDLELSPNTVASRYRYGLNKLRELLRPLYEEME